MQKMHGETELAPFGGHWFCLGISKQLAESDYVIDLTVTFWPPRKSSWRYCSWWHWLPNGPSQGACFCLPMAHSMQDTGLQKDKVEASPTPHPTPHPITSQWIKLFHAYWSLNALSLRLLVSLMVMYSTSSQAWLMSSRRHKAICHLLPQAAIAAPKVTKVTSIWSNQKTHRTHLCSAANLSKRPTSNRQDLTCKPICNTRKISNAPVQLDAETCKGSGFEKTRAYLNIGVCGFPFKHL